MNYNKLGLKEIRFINSGHFPNESVIIDDFTLLLGSSGVGKTTVMSAICYFYTMDKSKTRPLEKELSFYDWHLNGSYSHLIYVYENSIGRNALILSKDDGKVKHTFINIHNYEEDLTTLYLDSDKRCLSLKEILANCAKKSLVYYKSETVATFRKMMCKKSYRMLPNKDKPELDFSFYDSEESASIFGKYLFNIYSNSSVRDKGIKDMLISLIGEKEYFLDIQDFKNKLSEALKNVAHFELIKDRRDRILKLDDTIISYKALCDEIENITFELETISYNKDRIKTVIKDNHLSLLADEKIKSDKKDELLKEWKIKSTNYNTQIAQLNSTIKTNEDTYNNFHQKYRIENLITEQNRQNEYEKSLNELNIKVNAISSSIEELEAKEKTQKQKANALINEKKDNEKKELDSKKDNLITEVLQVSQNKEIEIEKGILSFEKELEIKNLEYTSLDKKISQDETALSYLPKQTLENSTTKKLKDEIERLSTLKSSIESQVKILNNEKEELEKEKDKSLKETNTKIQNELNEYIKIKDEFKSKIDLLNTKLDIGKNNLFGFLNKNNVSNKRKILALASDEVLFKESNFKFSLESSNDTFYGLKIDGDIEALATKYDLETLENSKASLQKQRDELVARYNIRYKNSQENLKTISSKYQKSIQEKSRAIYGLTPKIKDYEIKISNERKRLEEELIRLKEELDQTILDKKEHLKKDKEQLVSLKEHLSNIKENKSNFILEVNKKYKEQELDLNSKLDICKQSLNGINKKYAKQIEDSNKEIHNIYNEIKKKDNIDTDELELLQKSIKQQEKSIKDINDNRALVIRYKDEVLPNYNKIPYLNEQQSIAIKQRDKDRDYFDKEISLLDEKLNEIKKAIEKWKEYEKSFKNFELEILELDSDKSYEAYSDDEIKLLLNSRKHINTLDRFKTLENQQSEREKTIILETGKIIDGIPYDNMMKLKTKSDINSFEDNIEQYILIAKSYADFIKTKFDIEGTSLQLHRLIEAINDAVSKISHIKGTFNSIVKDVNKINRTIDNGIKNITVIDYIRLNFKDTGRDEIVTSIESIGDMLSANMLIGYENSQRSEQVKNELVKIAHDLQIALDKTFKKNITVADISSLTFDVSENAQVTKGIATLDSVGSNGTSIMIKAIIYITLLRMVANKFTNSGDIKYHCIIDEIGQISADYFTELMKYARHLEFVFINGTAANDDDIIEAYPRIYMGTRESSNHVELNLIDVRNAMEDW
ncbi:MAG: ATP-binding protein [Arcobacter sp.]|uniref:ATP-binding protein n=1 Tax=Arcobacter sp. TaxID=1872629 RepID=UPI003D020BC7